MPPHKERPAPLAGGGRAHHYQVQALQSYHQAYVIANSTTLAAHLVAAIFPLIERGDL
jgi:hypothetical protein